MRIIFMGTPDFAVPSLKALVEHHFDVIAVITAPDKPAGRGNKLLQPAVKAYALSQNMTILQPTNLKDPEFIETLRSFQADLQIVVAFRMLPEIVWNMPPLGTFNLHGSLLPAYRGAAPINWAIIRGETETGVTTFKLQHEIDTGSILFQAKEPIYPEDTMGTLYERLMHLGADLVVKTVQAIQENNYNPLPQDLKGEYPIAPKINREICEIDWNQPSEHIHNLIRGLSPVPAAWTTLLGKHCKIYKSSLEIKYPIPEDTSTQIGEYLTDNKKFLYFRTGKGWLSLEELQLEGKKRLEIKAFLAGNKL